MARSVREVVVADGESEKRPVSEWIEKLPPGDRAKAKAYLKRVLQRVEEGIALPIRDKFEGFPRLKWSGHGGTPHRILMILTCCCAILLCGYTHKDDVYKPREPDKIAERRQAGIEDQHEGFRVDDFRI